MIIGPAPFLFALWIVRKLFPDRHDTLLEWLDNKHHLLLSAERLSVDLNSSCREIRRRAESETDYLVIVQRFEDHLPRKYCRYTGERLRRE